MIDLFRPIRLGKVFSYSNQYIETSFLLFLIPLQSYFINLNTKEKIELPLNTTSLKNYYISFFVTGSGILFFVVMMSIGPTISADASNAYLGYLSIVISGLLIACGLILSFNIGKPGKFEMKKRTIFQSIVQQNALPEWLGIDTANIIYTKCREKLPKNWKEKVANGKFTSDEFFLYYTMLSYEHRIRPEEGNTFLLNQLNKKLNK